MTDHEIWISGQNKFAATYEHKSKCSHGNQMNAAPREFNGIRQETSFDERYRRSRFFN